MNIVDRASGIIFPAKETVVIVKDLVNIRIIKFGRPNSVRGQNWRDGLSHGKSLNL
jgi:hypothetical protein